MCCAKSAQLRVETRKRAEWGAFPDQASSWRERESGDGIFCSSAPPRPAPRCGAAVMSARLGHLKVSSLGRFTQSSLAYIRQFNLSFSLAKLVGNELRGGTEEPLVTGEEERALLNTVRRRFAPNNGKTLRARRSALCCRQPGRSPRRRDRICAFVAQEPRPAGGRWPAGSRISFYVPNNS